MSIIFWFVWGVNDISTYVYRHTKDPGNYRKKRVRQNPADILQQRGSEMLILNFPPAEIGKYRCFIEQSPSFWHYAKSAWST